MNRDESEYLALDTMFTMMGMLERQLAEVAETVEPPTADVDESLKLAAEALQAVRRRYWPRYRYVRSEHEAKMQREGGAR